MDNITVELYQGVLAMSWLEGFGVFFGIVYIFFAARESIWCWPASMVSVLLYLYICYSVQLYAEMGLQFYYIGTTIYGWYHWKDRDKDKDLPISTMDLRQHGLFIMTGLALTALLSYFLFEFTDAELPVLDSFTTVFSILNTILVTRKVLENWLYWIVIDAVGVYIYFERELYFTCLLFMAYLVIVLFGYFKWRRLYRVKYA